MKLDFKWLGGASWMLAIDGTKILCDPVLCPAGATHDYGFFKSRRINGPKHCESDVTDVKVWLFTHGHRDHCDLGTNNPVRSDDCIICNSSAEKALRRYGLKNVSALTWGAHKNISLTNNVEITIQAVPAVHGLNRLLGLIVGNGNGYWIDIKGENATRSIYATGDTLPNPLLLRAIRGKKCDLLIANAGSATVGSGLLGKLFGRITMNAADTTSLCAQIEAKKTVLIHWDAFEHYRERDYEDAVLPGHVSFMNPGDRISLL